MWRHLAVLPATTARRDRPRCGPSGRLRPTRRRSMRGRPYRLGRRRERSPTRRAREEGVQGTLDTRGTPGPRSNSSRRSSPTCSGCSTTPGRGSPIFRACSIRSTNDGKEESRLWAASWCRRNDGTKWEASCRGRRVQLDVRDYIALSCRWHSSSSSSV